jgi:hypothetical protein
MTTAAHGITAEVGDLRAIATQVAGALASVRLMDGRAFIRTPVLFASGSAVVIVVEQQPDGRFRVADFGQGYEEALQHGCAIGFTRRAGTAATSLGLAFQSRELFLAGVTREALSQAVALVASSVLRILEQARASAGEARERSPIARLAQRLRGLFPDRVVHEQAELRGASTQNWTVAVLLESERGQTVLDFVQPHLTAVSIEATKMEDLGARDNPPARVAIVRSKAAFEAPLLTLLARHARVIEREAPDATLRRAAA